MGQSQSLSVGRSCTLVLIHFIIFKITAANTSCSPILHCGLTGCLSPCQKGSQIHLFRFGSCRYAYTLRCWIIAFGMTSSNWVSKWQCTMLYHVSHVILHLDNTQSNSYFNARLHTTHILLHYNMHAPWELTVIVIAIAIAIAVVIVTVIVIVIVIVLPLSKKRDYKWNAKDCDERHYLVIYLSNSLQVVTENFYCSRI